MYLGDLLNIGRNPDYQLYNIELCYNHDSATGKGGHCNLNNP
jgi:hypothetical protein